MSQSRIVDIYSFKRNSMHWWSNLLLSILPINLKKHPNNQILSKISEQNLRRNQDALSWIWFIVKQKIKRYIFHIIRLKLKELLRITQIKWKKLKTSYKKKLPHNRMHSNSVWRDVDNQNWHIHLVNRKLIYNLKNQETAIKKSKKNLNNLIIVFPLNKLFMKKMKQL